MAEFVSIKDESELDALEAGDEVQTFDIGLFAEGDDEAGFHTANDPEQPFQRSNVIQRKGAVDIKCSCIDIIHGKWGPDSKEYATLLVLLFRFDPRKRARRISEADIKVKFFAMDGNDRKNPEVVAISLNDSYSLVPTKRTESVTTGTDGTLGGGALGATLSGTVKWEKTVGQETSDATHVVGSIDRLDVRYGPDNAASWTLRENETIKTGVPAAMRVGILLKRKTNDDFKCTVTLEADVDLKTAMGRFFGGREVDDPVLFKPSMDPTNKLMKYDTQNIGAFDITTIEDVIFTTMRDGVIKGHTA